MASPGTQKKKCDFSFASFFDNALSKDGGISIYRDRCEEFGVIGIAGYSGDLTAELSVTSKTAGVIRMFRNA